MSIKPKRVIPFFFAILLLVRNSFAYGPNGHEIVGAIADELLAQKPAGSEIKALIDGISLQKAAVMPDEIKSWDKKDPDDLNAFPSYPDHRKITNQLRQFWRANPPTHDMKSPIPSHHWFHYTDVPVLIPQKYADGKAGRSQWDIVHMSAYCVSVLRGETPEDNPRKITKPVAIILLAHYVGDIHQPLHVGAEYFDQAGQAVDPEKQNQNLEDEGGNTITLRLQGDEVPNAPPHTANFHGFWDNDAVSALLPLLPADISKEERRSTIEPAIRQLAHEMATHEPNNWRVAGEAKNYAQAWADEILPIAREAHERLQFDGVHPQQEEDRVVAAGRAIEKSNADHVAYRDWATKIVRAELHKAGWRLADILEKSASTTATSHP